MRYGQEMDIYSDYSQKYDLTIPAGDFDAEEILSDIEYENVQKLADHRKKLGE